MTAEVHIYRFKMVLFGVSRGFAVIKWCAQQTPVVMPHCVLMSGFIFYALNPLNNVELAPEVSLCRHRKIPTPPSA